MKKQIVQLPFIFRLWTQTARRNLTDYNYFIFLLSVKHKKESTTSELIFSCKMHQGNFPVHLILYLTGKQCIIVKNENRPRVSFFPSSEKQKTMNYL